MMKLTGEMFIFIFGVFLLFTFRVEGTSRVAINEKGFLIKELNGKNIMVVAGKIENMAYIQFYDKDTQVMEISTTVNSSGYVLDNTKCHSTGMDESFTDVDFRWIWVKWIENNLFVGPGKIPDDWGTSRLSSFTARPTTVVFLSEIGRSEWIFEDPVSKFHQNLYTKTEGRRGGVVGQRMKSVSALACIARCTQMNHCAAVNFSPYNIGDAFNCELILKRAKYKLCNEQDPNRITGYTSATDELNWNIYIKL